MAASTIRVTSVLLHNTAYADAALTALDGSDGGLLTPTVADEKILIRCTNSSTTSNLTVTAGTGYAGTANLVISATGSATVAFVLESGKYLQTTGTNKGKILFTGSANLSLGAYQLP